MILQLISWELVDIHENGRNHHHPNDNTKKLVYLCNTFPSSPSPILFHLLKLSKFLNSLMKETLRRTQTRGGTVLLGFTLVYFDSCLIDQHHSKGYINKQEFQISQIFVAFL